MFVLRVGCVSASSLDCIDGRHSKLHNRDAISQVGLLPLSFPSTTCNGNGSTAARMVISINIMMAIAMSMYVPVHTQKLNSRIFFSQTKFNERCSG